MKKNLILTLVFAFVLGLGVSGVQAASVSLLPTPQNVGIGLGTVVFDVFADFSDYTDPGILGGSIDISYDANILGFSSFDYNALLANDPENDVYIPDTSVLGTISDIRFANFDIFNNGFNAGTFSIGTLTFDSLNLGSSLVDLAGGTFQWNDFSFNIINPTYNDANVNVVPIPATMLLFGSSIFGLVGLRRMKRS